MLYFVLSNFPKVWNCLEQLRATERFADRSTVRLLDVGAGPGTATLATLEYWKAHAPNQTLDCLAIDQNAEILQDARQLCERVKGKAAYRSRALDLHWRNIGQALHGERFDIIVAMNVLNEFGDVAARARLVNALLQNHLSHNGVLIYIEPGLQRTTRELMELRDLLLCHSEQSEESSVPTGSFAPLRTCLRSAQDDKQPHIHILAPCLHHDACPMRKHNARDWCHFYLDWERPKIIADLDRLIGNKKEYLKFSYLILTASLVASRQSLATAVTSDQRPVTSDRCYRVVSAPLRSKGKTELLLCPSQGNDTGRLYRLTRLDKERGPANADMDRVMRGDIVTVSGTEHLSNHDAFAILARHFAGGQ